MKKFLISILAVLCLMVQTAFAADFSRLVILHTNDSHGFDLYDESAGNIGMASVAQLKLDLEKDGYEVDF